MRVVRRTAVDGTYCFSSRLLITAFFSFHAFQLFIVVICRIEASMEGIGDDSMMSRIGSTFIHDWWMCSCESMQDRRHHTHECTSYIYNERMFIVYVESIRFFIVRAITLYRREDIEWKVTCDNLCFFICYFLIHFFLSSSSPSASHNRNLILQYVCIFFSLSFSLFVPFIRVCYGIHT